MSKNTFFTSDLHLGQRNIITKLSNWNDLSATRDFNSIDHMDSTIIDNINKMVGINDTLWHMGDLTVKNEKEIDQILAYLLRINCQDIRTIAGNHDHFLRDEKIKKRLLEEGYFTEIHDYGTRIKVSFYEGNGNPHTEKWTGSQEIILAHYAMRVWDRSHHGSWMLYGHSHTSLDKKAGDFRDEINNFYLSKKTMDVGIDNAFRLLGEYRPFSFWEIKEIMNTKEILYIDHHEKKP